MITEGSSGRRERERERWFILIVIPCTPGLGAAAGSADNRCSDGDDTACTCRVMVIFSCTFPTNMYHFAFIHKVIKDRLLS